jgi:capsular polysaccharide biosynthesis protein
LFKAEYVKELPAVYSHVERFCFIPPSGWLFNRFFLDNYQFTVGQSSIGRIKAYSRSLLALFHVRKIVMVERGLYLTNSNSVNFFHWFLDVLQKAECLVGLLGNEIRSQFTIVLPADHNSQFMRDSLNAFDFNCRWLSRNELAVINNLTVIPDIAPTGNYRKDVVQGLSKRLAKHFSKGLTFSSSKNKIYITRRNAQRRRIINEDQLTPILIRYDFVIVDFDTLSFRDQLSYSLGGRVLVSMHGAGLTHMLWMEQPSIVLEIRSRDDCQNNCYYNSSDLSQRGG